MSSLTSDSAGLKRKPGYGVYDNEAYYSHLECSVRSQVSLAVTVTDRSIGLFSEAVRDWLGPWILGLNVVEVEISELLNEYYTV